MNVVGIPLAHEPTKKRAHATPFVIFRFFSSINQFKKDDETQVGLLEDLMFFVFKGYLPMRTIESI